MSPSSTSLQPCAQCGARLPLDSTAGLCAACLVRVVTEENTSDATDPGAAEGNTGAFAPRIGVTFGDYRIEAPLGEGGMGVVYRARQISLNRTVAVKMLPFGRFAPDAHQKRFRAEAETIAQLRHPNIVTVFEIGEHDGQPFLSMEFVDGPDLAHVLRERTPSVREAAQLAARVAEAIHYAHQRGIAHRDLKPSNILVEADGRPRVSDFGLAKNLASDGDLTLTGQAIGSPHYIPPEQAAGRHDAPFPASDVYGIGAILYHLLTRRPPFIGESIAAVLHQLADTEPVPPRLLNPDVPRDLETICLKCLEKDPARRFTSAGELAEELERFLRDEPICARPITTFERGWRWCRRRPALAATSATLVLVLCAGFVTSSILWQREQLRAEEATEHLLRVELEQAESLFDRGESPDALARLARLLRAHPRNTVVAQRIVSALTHRNFILPASPEIEDTHDARILTLSVGGDLACTATTNGHAITLWNVDRALARVGEIALSAPARVATLSKDGTRLAVVLRDGTLQVWNLSDAAVGGTLRPDQLSESLHRGVKPLLQVAAKLPALPTALQFDVAGARLLALSEPVGIDLVDAVTGQVVKQFATSHFAEFSPDGRWLVTVEDVRATWWHAATLEPTAIEIQHEYRLETARFSADSRRLVTASADYSARTWDVATGERAGPPLWHDRQLLDAVFSPDGQRVLTVTLSARAQIWDAASGRAMSEPFPQWRQLHREQFSPDGLWLVSFYYDHVFLRDGFTGATISEPLRLAGTTNAARFLADGGRFVTTAAHGHARLWSTRPGDAAPILLPESIEVARACFSPDGTRILTSAKNREARVWSAADGRPVTPPLLFERRVTCSAFDPTGALVAAADFSGDLSVFDASSGALRAGPLKHDGEVTAVVFSPDSRWVASSSMDGRARVWDIADGSLRWTWRHEAGVRDIAMSRDGKLFATVGDDRTVRVWSATNGECVATFTHADAVWCLAFTPDGQWVVAGDRAGSVRFWNVAQRAESGPPLLHEGAVVALNVSRDGRQLATASWDQTARVWDVVSRRALSRPLAHNDRVQAVSLSPDGRHVATASLDRTARVWDVVTGQPVSDALPHGNAVVDVHWSPDGRSLLTASWDGAAHLWAMPLLRAAPDAESLATLAEAFGGLYLADDETARRAAPGLAGDLAPIPAKTDEGRPSEFASWMSWMLADRSTRPISPGAAISAADHARSIIRDERDWSDRARTMLRYLPADAEGLARWSRLVLQQNPERNARKVDEALFAAEFAVKFDPESFESWWSLAAARSAAGEIEGARRAYATAQRLAPLEMDDEARAAWEKLRDALRR
jgi:eukaryotic-like serine/threonine-protein kinase